MNRMNTRVLLIDDDEDEQWIFSEALKEIDDSIHCSFALTGKQGLKLLEEVLPDFVFLDMNMPAVNGLELLEIIKNNKTLANLLVIMYSTGVNEKLTSAAVSKGAFGCVKKESSIHDLANELKKYLGTKLPGKS